MASKDEKGTASEEAKKKEAADDKKEKKDEKGKKIKPLDEDDIALLKSYVCHTLIQSCRDSWLLTVM
jgi:hypothetical protein